MNGTLIVESLRVGTRLDDCDITVRAIRRFATHDLPEYQPPIWTVLDFEADDSLAEHLATELSAVLDEPGWYVNFSTSSETFVIYPGMVFRYVRGDRSGRGKAQAHGRAVGVPEPQLDWAE
jgi:hypothetical protein